MIQPYTQMKNGLGVSLEIVEALQSLTCYHLSSNES